MTQSINPDLKAQLDSVLSVFDLPEDHPIHKEPIFEVLEHAHETFENRKFAMQDPNTLALWEYLRLVRQWEEDGKYKNCFINFIKILIVLFNVNPWVRSRLGHFMWYCGCACNPDAYVPAKVEDLYDPRNWYKAGEPRRACHGGIPEGQQPPGESGLPARYEPEDMGIGVNGESGQGERSNPYGRVQESTPELHETPDSPPPTHRTSRRNRNKGRSN